ncbi:hypothetical protein DERP_008975 [Dermatophagoides pteronyssinus]|uniref:Uncharacterized protein n=1 Tax=Dermatophagoides pteronyssinus TaxID=6956 RepID=A0ABQ8JG56_DERPT|nr:hypothetical protein DERP_008975 [Dermatophagoides pteronyssinus]
MKWNQKIEINVFFCNSCVTAAAEPIELGCCPRRNLQVNIRTYVRRKFALHNAYNNGFNVEFT